MENTKISPKLIVWQYNSRGLYQAKETFLKLQSLPIKNKLMVFTKIEKKLDIDLKEKDCIEEAQGWKEEGTTLENKNAGYVRIC